MNLQIAKKWIAALKSGKYHKTTSQLWKRNKNRHYSYCCLGVLTDLYCKEQGLNRNKISCGDGSFLGFKIQKWAGMKSSMGEIPDLIIKDLVQANDGDPSADIKQHSFKEIAKLINKYKEKL